MRLLYVAVIATEILLVAAIIYYADAVGLTP